MNVSGPDSSLRLLRARGLSFPVNMDMIYNIEAFVNTGSVGKGRSFPFELDYRKMTIAQIYNGYRKVMDGPLQGAVVKGHYDAHRKMEIDTIISDKINNAGRKLLRNAIAGLEHAISFPKKPMKVGDHFVMKVPMNMPVAGFNTVHFVVNTEYLLTSIGNNEAHFKVKQEVEMDDASQGKVKIQATGKGEGMVVYDLSARYITQYETALHMLVDVKMGGLDMQMKIVSTANQHVRVQ